MLNSRNIDDLRTDVAANCRKLIELAKADGWPVLVTGTVRDDEYQQCCYEKGTGGKPPATFHSVKAGLAFDICKNIKGQEYSDGDFWAYCGALGQKMGFEWGGTWRSLVDKPHFQWSQDGRYTSAMIRAGKYPPAMPLYEEDEDMTQEKFNELMKGYLAQLAGQEPSEWSAGARAWAEENGILTGDENGSRKYKAFATREQLVQLLYRVRG